MRNEEEAVDNRAADSLGDHGSTLVEVESSSSERSSYPDDGLSGLLGASIVSRGRLGPNCTLSSGERRREEVMGGFVLMNDAPTGFGGDDRNPARDDEDDDQPSL